MARPELREARVSTSGSGWQDKGVWQRLLDHPASDADPAWVMLDGTVVRAHA